MPDVMKTIDTVNCTQRIFQNEQMSKQFMSGQDN